MVAFRRRVHGEPWAGPWRSTKRTRTSPAPASPLRNAHSPGACRPTTLARGASGSARLRPRRLPRRRSCLTSCSTPPGRTELGACTLKPAMSIAENCNTRSHKHSTAVPVMRSSVWRWPGQQTRCTWPQPPLGAGAWPVAPGPMARSYTRRSYRLRAIAMSPVRSPWTATRCTSPAASAGPGE